VSFVETHRAAVKDGESEMDGVSNGSAFSAYPLAECHFNQQRISAYRFSLLLVYILPEVLLL
jgi:hypothetical protein